jgi:hypothetical protein
MVNSQSGYVRRPASLDDPKVLQLGEATWRGWDEMIGYSYMRYQDREESGPFGNRFPEDRRRPKLSRRANKLLAAAPKEPSEPSYSFERGSAEEWAAALIDRARRGDAAAQQEIADITRQLDKEVFYKLCRQLGIPECRPRRKKPDTEVSARTLRRRKAAARADALSRCSARGRSVAA